MSDSAVSIVSDLRCELGEGPYWDEQRGCVFWTDIPAGKIYRHDFQTGLHSCIYTGEPVGGFTLQENGDLLLFRISDIALLSLDTGALESIIPFRDEGMKRFNDVIADPEGRVFAGTIGDTPTSGGLYRVETDGTIQKLFTGTGCANGMGFSPDLKTFYWTCSTTRRIFRFDYNQSTGDLTNRQLFYEAEPEEGVPDGLKVDSEGCVWSARWGGFSIKQHDANGTILSALSFPVRNVTSLCFGGKNLGQFFITTAQEPGEQSDIAGALLTLPSQKAGTLQFRSRVSSAR